MAAVSAPGGITALCLLTESHLSLHTYPEKGVATINLYCCRPRPAWDWERRLRELLGARQVSVRLAVRGAMEVAVDHFPRRAPSQMVVRRWAGGEGSREAGR